MEYAMVAVAAAPVRRKARHQAEMISQLLFGETVSILKEKKAFWLKVRSIHDGYEGWMTANLLREISKKEAVAPALFAATDLVNTLSLGTSVMTIPFGSSLPGLKEGSGRVGDFAYAYTGRVADRQSVRPSGELIMQLTRPWLNAPYMWGGRTLMGVDCSGFVQVNFKMMGIDLPRDAWQQAQAGKTVERLRDAVCGDLAFFDDKDEIVHVGILLGPDQIIHASGIVRIDPIDKKGITNAETGRRTHFLKSIKRYW